MPKKQPKNAFYFYMLDFKEEQRKKGINYANMKEVAEAAGIVWKNVVPAVRSKYETIAKNEKNKPLYQERKYTSTGELLSDVERRLKEQKDAEEAERKDINNLVALKSFNKDVILQEYIYLMDVNSYCQVKDDYLIGELTLLRFTIKDGIYDHYHEILNPSTIPIGYASEIKNASIEFGLPIPDETREKTNYMQVLATIIEYLKKEDKGTRALPPIFTLPARVPLVKNFLQQMCLRAAEDDSIFRVYKLETLFFTLMNRLRTSPDEGFPKESLALLHLKKDPFRYSPDIECEHHKETDVPTECTNSRTKRWAFTVLDCCCPVVGVEAIPGKHLPVDYDLNSILALKEQRMERAVPSVASNAVPASPDSSSTVTDTSHNMSGASNYVPTDNVKPKRTHVPLRQPKTLPNWIRPPPEFTEEEFPKLGGTGRGRVLASSLDKMKLDK